ncbi:unnamed protein product [Porites lobata]|uniref:Uncharacterized protein n=1 Tax=Porites lobata TaxID=104759 RepID=A0ABN8R5M6_9CNID|nr:unnamed protein product [Porites lobata]
MAGAPRNKHSKLLLGVIYSSDLLMTASYWLECFEDLLSHITSTWDGMVILTSAVNFDLIGVLTLSLHATAIP